MNNGTEENVINQFNIISGLPAVWDHNQHYHNYLLKKLDYCSLSLDIGCGTGELTRLLCTYSEKVTGIDISREMIHTALKRNRDKKIEYKNIDAMEYLTSTDRTFGVIISIAAFHHMEERKMLELIKSKLSKKGKLIILDLYKQETLLEYALSFLAMLVNPIMMLIKRGRLFVTKKEREAWRDHFQYDNYLTIKEIKNISREILGKVVVKRHLFWRYSLIYEN
ncbi:MAG: class I SAM-dependent methyltransferase [Spirochaetales bacterium]|nr:class I SAM-dependent methyltransferase [Spirochaetales bacterium]